MKPVLCVTLNPCLDKTLVVPHWNPGDNVRGKSIREVVGGKGNNVARALRRLNVAARPVTFLGGSTGRRCAELLSCDDGFEPLIVDSVAETRTILTVRTGESANQTAFFDPDPQITPEEADRLRKLIETSIEKFEVAALTLSGSSPAMSTHGLYADFIHLARNGGVPVLLDTYGPAMKHASTSVPDVIQANRKEVAGALGISVETVTEPELLQWLMNWIARGTRLAVVTQGPDAVLAASAEGCFRVIVPKIEPVNPIGSGDSVMAGLCRCMLENASTQETLRYAVACGVANAAVWDAGAIDADMVSVFAEVIEVHKVVVDVAKAGRIGGT